MEAKDGAVRIEGKHLFLFWPWSKEGTSSLGASASQSPPCWSRPATVGKKWLQPRHWETKMPAAREARPPHAVSGWKGTRTSWNVVFGRQLQDNAVLWPCLTDKEPEASSSVTRPRSYHWLLAVTPSEGILWHRWPWWTLDCPGLQP